MTAQQDNLEPLPEFDKMVCCSFIFEPGVYDADFHALDDDIARFARSLPGFVRVENWQSAGGRFRNSMYFFTDQNAVRELAAYPRHREAKEQHSRWYLGYRVDVFELRGNYGGGSLGGQDRTDVT